MKYFFLITLSVLLFSCKKKGETTITEKDSADIIIYDSCEYIVIGGGNAQMMSHKGNCKNCLNKK